MLETALAHINTLFGLSPHNRAKSTTFFELAKLASGPVIELGALRGCGTIALAYGTRAGAGFAVYAVDDYAARPNWVGSRDGNEQDAALIGPNLTTARVREFVHLVSGEFLAVARHWPVPAGLVLWDGGTRTGLAAAFAAWVPHILPGGYFAFRSVDDDGLGCVPILQAAVDAGGWGELREWPGYIWSVRRAI